VLSDILVFRNTQKHLRRINLYQIQKWVAMDIEQLAGTKLGNYEIESLLDRGGISVVYKARQINLDRPVAQKVLLSHLSSVASSVKRFHREVEAIARLHHANIVQIYDIGEDQNLHFFTSRWAFRKGKKS
jgi:serine/threonine protein kinase